MTYETFGPFTLQRDGIKPAVGAFKKFWKEVQASSKLPLFKGIGIYILAMKSKDGNGLVPWYVGRTCIQGFQLRFEQKSRHFIEILAGSETGELVIFFLALTTPSGVGLRKATSLKGGIASNKWLEKKLIDECYELNPKLINVADAKHRKAVIVPGYLNDGQRPEGQSSEALRQMLRPTSSN